MATWLQSLITTAFLCLAGCASPTSETVPGNPRPAPTEPPGLRFSQPVPVSTEYRGGEPILAVAPDGTLYVAAPTLWEKSADRASLAGRLWGSRDGGATFDERGTPGARGLAGGGADSDLAVAADGTLYYADLSAASVSLAQSSDGGASWSSSNPSGAPLPADDRPWIAVGGDSLYVAALQLPTGLWVGRTRDLGLTWDARTLAVPATAPVEFAAPGPIEVDPSDPRILYVPIAHTRNAGVGSVEVAITRDAAASFEIVRISDVEVFGPGIATSLAVDTEGAVHLVFVAGRPGERRVFLSQSIDQGTTWSPPEPISPEGDALQASIVAGDDGRIAVAWYGRHDGYGEGFQVLVTTLAEASTKRPRVTIGVASTEPVGEAGGGSNDLLGLAVDARGQLLISWATDAQVVRVGPTFHTEGTVVFASQTAGPSLLVV